MLNPTLRRTVFTAGALLATGTMLLTTASAATAAPAAKPIRTQAAAQAAVIKVASQTALHTGRVRVISRGSYITESAPEQATIPGQTLLRLGVASAKAAAGASNRSYGCSGVLSQGGSLQIGDDGSECRAAYPSSGGVSIDLGSLTSALPVGVGGISITANGITANARYVEGQVSGLGRIDNAFVNVCLGVMTNGTCVGVPVKLKLAIKGGVNQDLLTAITTALTGSPLLSTVVTPILNALRPVVNLRTNVQTVNPDTGVITVTGLKLIALNRAAAVTGLAIAQAGPYN